MNIAFLLRYWPVYGGGETVTRILANKFAELGHTVSVVYLWERNSEPMPFIDSAVKQYEIPGISKPYGEDGIYKNNFKKIEKSLRNYFVNNHISIIINQWLPARVVYEAKKNTPAKAICCHHTAVQIKPAANRFIHKILFMVLKNFGWKIWVYKNMLPKYKYSDKLVMLSGLFVRDVKNVLNTQDRENKICAIANPLLYEEFITKNEMDKKQKELLFVGRILNSVKRITFILDVWQKLQNTGKYNEWQLTIVGDGPDLNDMKNYASTIGCSNINFEGYQNPLAYYRRSSIFLMTSSFEGWGMTLVEAQQNGCVPVALDSYSSLHEIIQHENNGLIVPDNDLSAFAVAVERLMQDDEFRLKLAYNGIETCKRFSANNTVRQWEALFAELAGKP